MVITRGPELVSFQWDKNMDHYLGIQNGRFFVVSALETVYIL